MHMVLNYRGIGKCPKIVYDTEKINMTPTKEWHAQIKKWSKETPNKIGNGTFVT